MNPQVISFNCVLKNRAGKFISSTYNHDVLTSSLNNEPAMLSGLAKGLQNLSKGEKRRIQLSAEEAYGLYDPKKVILFPLNKLPASIKKGQPITIVSKKGIERSYIVLEMHSDFASLDGNHPLAGQDLIFEIEALDARAATDEEIEDSSNPLTNRSLH